MKVSLNWLKDYVEIKLKPNQLVKELTLRSIEVNTMEKTGEVFEKLVIGRVLKVEKHPNADRLSVCKVDIGQKNLEIVCGARNIKEGQKVVVAKPGTKVFSSEGEEMIIKRADIRGVKSQGMICSEKELGIGSDQSGIKILDPRTNIGKKFSEVYGNADLVLDLDVLSNRPDCMSHQGVAREIAAITGGNLRIRKYQLEEKPKEELDLNVAIKNKKLCPRYSAIVLSNVEVKESPDWIKRRLEAVEIRPINNIVDITNFLMMDTGQPTHAFDYDKIKGQKMTVREARKGEKVITLDDTSHKLEKGMLIIEDSKRLIDLAGIMGSKNSEISLKSAKIVLQAAVFDTINIRKTSRSLGFRSDAVSVYEKGVDVNNTLNVLAQGFHLLKKQNPKIVLEKIIDFKGKEIKPLKLSLSLDNLNNLIGIKYPEDKVVNILKSLEMEVKKKPRHSTGSASGGKESNNVLEVTVPTFRPDIKAEEDLIEEVTRIYGYQKVSEALPFGAVGAMPGNEKISWQKKVKDLLKTSRFNEVINYSFYSKDDIKKSNLTLTGHIEIENPLSEAQQYLRSCLQAGLLQNLRKNQKNFESIKIFEIGKVFWTLKKKPHEKEILMGMRMFESGKKVREKFLELKGLIESLFNELGIAKFNFGKLTKKDKFYDSKKSISIIVSNKEIGVIGKVSDSILRNYKLTGKVICFSLDFEKVLSLASGEREYQPLPKFPGIKRDLAVVIDKKVPFEELKEMIRKSSPLITKAELFDIYQGKQLPKGKKNLAFHVIFQDKERTLEASEIDKIIEKITKKLDQKLKAKIRSW